MYIYIYKYITSIHIVFRITYNTFFCTDFGVYFFVCPSVGEVLPLYLHRAVLVYNFFFGKCCGFF